ncbi:MAG: GHMP kinase [Fidelibacterota bacterium]|nr:MAG: GHMP kinase [Candidatus Neomarinimicrobiota bacterium]
MTQLNHLTISAPGRICLFGEHQDYLDLPVIPAAISLRIRLEGARRNDRDVNIELPDIDDRIGLSLDDASYRRERDYFPSSVNILKRAGFTFSSGFDCTVHGGIPINSGTSSSTALVMAWVKFLGLMSDQRITLSPGDNAELAHQAEVVEFQEPGGKMDHYSIAYGDVIYLDFQPQLAVEHLISRLGTFILGDSGEPKDTKGILTRVKQQIQTVVQTIKEKESDFLLLEAHIDELEKYRSVMNAEQYALLRGTIMNRDITLQAREALKAGTLNEESFGELLNQHQSVLRDVLQISTPKIDRMLSAAMQAGAMGGKINGSGGGGCMFVYAPRQTDQVADAIESAGGNAYIIGIDEGVKIERAVE